MDTFFIIVVLLVILIFFTSRAKNKKSKIVLPPKKIILQPPPQQIYNKCEKEQMTPPMELITSEIPCKCEIDMQPIPRDVSGVDDRYVDIIERRKLNKRTKTGAAKRTVNLYKENFNNELDAEDNRVWWGEDEY